MAFNREIKDNEDHFCNALQLQMSLESKIEDREDEHDYI